VAATATCITALTAAGYHVESAYARRRLRQRILVREPGSKSPLCPAAPHLSGDQQRMIGERQRHESAKHHAP
jgi:hypothetical protein